MLKSDIDNHVMKKAKKCTHSFIPVSKAKTDKYEHTTQLMCSLCLILIDFEDVAGATATYREAISLQ